MSKYVRIKSKESKGFKKNCVKVADKTFTFEKYPVGTRPEFEKTLGLLQPVVEFLNADHEEVEAEIYQAIKHIQDGDRESLEMVSTIAALEGDIKEISQEYNRVSAVAKEALESNRVLSQEKGKRDKSVRELAEELRLEMGLSDQFKKAALEYKALYDSVRPKEQTRTEGQAANDCFGRDCHKAREEYATQKENITPMSKGFREEALMEAIQKAERILYPPFGYDFRVQQPKSSIFHFEVPERKKEEEPLTSEMVERHIFGVNPCKSINIPKDQKREFIQKAFDMGWRASDYLGSVMFSGTKGPDKYVFKKSFVDGRYRMRKNEQVMVTVPEPEEYEYYLPILSDLITSGGNLKDVVFVTP